MKLSRVVVAGLLAAAAFGSVPAMAQNAGMKQVLMTCKTDFQKYCKGSIERATNKKAALQSCVKSNISHFSPECVKELVVAKMARGK